MKQNGIVGIETICFPPRPCVRNHFPAYLCVGQSIESLVQHSVVRGDVQNDGRERVPAQAVPQYSRELRLSVKDVWGVLHEGFDHSSERQEALFVKI